MSGINNGAGYFARNNSGYNQQAIAAGYQWDPVQSGWVKTPKAAGTAVNEYNQAANPSLAALLSQFGGGGTAGVPGVSGSSSGAASGTAPGFSGGPISGGTGMTPPPPGATPPPAAGATPHIAPPDTTQQNAAIFSRAKDTAGSIARASLNSLNGELGASGMIGSGAQVQGDRDIIATGAGQLADVNRQNMINDANQATEFAKLNYTGDLTQRGQDLGYSSTSRGQDLNYSTAYRGQDIQSQEANANLALATQDRYMKMLQLLMQSYGGSGGSGGYNPTAY